MAISLSKMAPSAIMVAAVGYCCFPYLNQPGMPPAVNKEISKSHEIPLELLSPNVGSTQARDPFDLKAKDDKGTKGGQVAGKKDGAKVIVKDGKPMAPESAVAQAVREAAVRAAAAEKAAKELHDALKGLVLNGTYVSSNRRVAVINSHLYAEGQTVRPVATAAKSFVVSRIDQHKVVLQLGAQTAELGYPKLPAKTDKKKPAPTGQQATGPVLQPL